MIQVGVSYGFGEDNRYNTSKIPPNIQLAMYKYDLYKNNEEAIVSALKEAKTNVLTVHLPLDTVKIKASKILDIIDLFGTEFNCNHFIVHPNKGFGTFLEYFLKGFTDTDYQLCIETFGWRSRKVLRSPLDILECNIAYPTTSMCIDTSHIEKMWFDHKILYKLLPYTDVIHLSNRCKGYGQHLPFNSQLGELNLVGFVKDLKHKFLWSGKIILEYMPEYQYKLYKNAKYLQWLIDE